MTATQKIYTVRSAIPAFGSEETAFERPESDVKYNLKIIDQDLELIDALAGNAGTSRSQLLNHLVWMALSDKLRRMPADQRAWLLMTADRSVSFRRVDTPWVADFYDEHVTRAREDRDHEPHSYEYRTMLGLEQKPVEITRCHIDFSLLPKYEYVTLRPEPKLREMFRLFEKHDVWRKGLLEWGIRVALERFALSNREHAYLIEELTRKFLPDGPHPDSVLGRLLKRGIVRYDVIELDE
ncbi:hypothetical protein [Sutterella sp.]|uniref:hypothetical protein n=1 Tax=Sutterella sp. TaxID=1981025 RepID=UPI0026DF42BE|nr:hypothetical protein [Sutterella sp.]MDO5532001.1 hypothetical protein [Sutterella sp.]